MAVGELPRQGASFERALAQHEVARLARRLATARRVQRLPDHLFPVARILFEELQHAGVHCGLHDPLDLCGTELRLCLSLELRIDELHGDDGGEPLANVFAGEVRIVVFDRAVLAAPVVQRTGERCAESGDVRSAVDRVDVVGEREQRLGPRVALILEGNLDVCGSVDALQEDGTIMGHLALPVEVSNERDDAALEVEGCFAIGAIVDQREPESLVEVGRFAQTIGERLERILGRGKHFGIRQEDGPRSAS